MDKMYDLKSILNAIEDINTKKKKIVSTITKNSEKIKNNNLDFEKIELTTYKNKKNIFTSDEILPLTEKIILEAENHSNKIKINIPTTKETIPLAKKLILKSKDKLNELKNKNLILTPLKEEVLILDNEYKSINLETDKSEEIKLNVIDDLYSSLSQKVKKNTLKVIFDLHKKIYELEKQIEFISINKTDLDFEQTQNINKISENKEHLINEENSDEDEYLDNKKTSDEDEHLINQEDDDLSASTIKTLKIQNSLIKNFERDEEKMRLKIVDLEQDISILTNKKNNFNNETVVSQKDNSKIYKELIFFKENYEKLIIDNHDLKKKLSISKERIIMFEKNIKELENAFENLNNIMSKNSIIKLNE
jgi:hypothetical protein